MLLPSCSPLSPTAQQTRLGSAQVHHLCSCLCGRGGHPPTSPDTESPPPSWGLPSVKYPWGGEWGGWSWSQAGITPSPPLSQPSSSGGAKTWGECTPPCTVSPPGVCLVEERASIVGLFAPPCTSPPTPDPQLGSSWHGRKACPSLQLGAQLRCPSPLSEMDSWREGRPGGVSAPLPVVGGLSHTLGRPWLGGWSGSRPGVGMFPPPTLPSETDDWGRGRDAVI